MLSITMYPRRFPTSHKRHLFGRALAVASPIYHQTTPMSTNTVSYPLKLTTSLMKHSMACSGNVMIRPFSLGNCRSIHTPFTSKSSSSQAFSTAAMEECSMDDDDYLYGPRRDDWFTTDRNPRIDPTFPGKDPTTGRLTSIAMPNLATCTRSEMLDYLDNTWALTDALFATVQGEQAFLTPPPHQLRHPLIFYYGHPTVFYVNKLVVAGLLDQPKNPYFEEIFEVGVDEMRWDDMSKNEMEWPRVADVTAYRRAIYSLVRELLENHPGLEKGHAPIDNSNELWAVCMALEHERIHLETSSMLMLEHSIDLFESSDLLAAYHPSAYRPSSKHPVVGTDYPRNDLISIPSTSVKIGKPHAFPTFGWDNEYGSKDIQVPECEVSKFMISNGEFWEFVSSQAYLEPSYWSPLGWEWRCFRNTKWPQFWVPDGPSGSHQYKLRALFDVIPMQWDWPAQVNYHEAHAFCQWKTQRENSQSVYHMTTEPIHQILRNTKDTSAVTTHDDVLLLAPHETMSRQFQKNTNLSYASFAPVNAHPPTEKGFYDVMGNAWEWCEDLFSALPGFTLHPYYDDFSAPCFDGEHQVIMGGSFISTGDNGVSKYARYHFRPHFFQHAGFRLVRQSVNPDTQEMTLATTCVNAPGPYVNTNPYRTRQNVSISARHTNGVKTAETWLNDFYYQSETALEQFMASLPHVKGKTMLIRNGIENISCQVDSEGLLVIITPHEKEKLEGYERIQTSLVPVFTKQSENKGCVMIQHVTAWKKT